MSVSEQIDQFIAENGGNTRDALNVALARIEQMEMKLAAMKANFQIEIVKARCDAQFQIIKKAIEAAENLPESQ